MTFSDIRNRVYFLTGTSSTEYSNANMTISLAKAMNRVVSLININSGWQYDDLNNTDLPIATTTLTSDQQDYALATAHLTIDRIEVKDSSGNWHLLDPIDQQELKRDRKIALSEYRETSGLPQEYDLVGNSIFLYPTPNYTQAASLKVYFSRGPLEFSYTTEQFTDSTGSLTSTPGFISLFHELLPLWMAYDYAIAADKSNATSLFTEIVRLEQEMKEFYGLRNRDTRPRLRVSTDSNE